MQAVKLNLSATVYAVFFIAAVFFFLTGPAAGTSILNTDKDTYQRGEPVKVMFSNSPGANGDWICIVPTGAPDTEAGDYQYIPKGSSQGTLTFDSPVPGQYEVRAYYNYRRYGYAVSARHGFSVASGVPSRERDTARPVKPRGDAEKTITAGKPPVASVSKGSSRFSVSVFHFRPLNIDASNYGITVTNTLLHAPRMQSEFAMMDRKDLETFLIANDLQQNDQIENVIQVGTKIGLNFVIAGSVEKKGSRIVTNCKVIGIEQRKVVFTSQSVSTGEANLVNDILKMSDAIIEAIRHSNS